MCTKRNQGRSWRLSQALSCVFSWQDGDSEYLSDLDRQVMQKKRLLQVRLNSWLLMNDDDMSEFSRCLVNEKLKHVAVISRTSTAFGGDRDVEHLRWTRTNLNWTICFTMRRCIISINIKADSVQTIVKLGNWWELFFCFTRDESNLTKVFIIVDGNF